MCSSAANNASGQQMIKRIDAYTYNMDPRRLYQIRDSSELPEGNAWQRKLWFYLGIDYAACGVVKGTVCFCYEIEASSPEPNHVNPTLGSMCGNEAFGRICYRPVTTANNMTLGFLITETNENLANREYINVNLLTGWQNYYNFVESEILMDASKATLRSKYETLDVFFRSKNGFKMEDNFDEDLFDNADRIPQRRENVLQIEKPKMDENGFLKVSVVQSHKQCRASVHFITEAINVTGRAYVILGHDGKPYSLPKDVKAADEAQECFQEGSPVHAELFPAPVDPFPTPWDEEASTTLPNGTSDAPDSPAPSPETPDVLKLAGRGLEPKGFDIATFVGINAFLLLFYSNVWFIVLVLMFARCCCFHWMDKPKPKRAKGGADKSEKTEFRHTVTNEYENIGDFLKTARGPKEAATGSAQCVLVDSLKLSGNRKMDKMSKRRSKESVSSSKLESQAEKPHIRKTESFSSFSNVPQKNSQIAIRELRSAPAPKATSKTKTASSHRSFVKLVKKGKLEEYRPQFVMGFFYASWAYVSVMLTHMLIIGILVFL
ncbi:hypothetical protein L596_022275 [Steinernema carpocapsae]|uniref:Uncharacterized protein n=1 Tax=Steinernema carpocapsae TaxID=34508 RepID=A0A4V6A063_STECR|nr:hypothetical protein L596_022275 [Steinernema carpocapsae]